MSTYRRILVDNATLSGVERIAGISQTANLNYVDNDILCLEKLITAILFSDALIGVDDYKSEFRSNRLKRFSFIDFLKLEESQYQIFASEAAAFAKSMSFRFEGSKPSGDVLSFFEALRISPQLRWDIFVSSEYLTLSYLVEDTKHTTYERSIDSVFRNEDVDRKMVDEDYAPTISVDNRSDINDIKDLVEALRSANPQYAGTDGKSALARIVFGYGWTAERSHFYNAVAQIHNADAYLSPLRDAFCESCCRLDYPGQIPSLIEALKSKSTETIHSILEPSGRARFAMRLPFFTAYLITMADSPLQCIELALSMRSRQEFQDCRTIFHNLDHVSSAERVQEINGILKYLSQSCFNLMKKYAVSTANGSPFSISVGLTGFSIETKLSGLFRSYKNRAFSRVFRNIAQDMISVERLGGLHDKLCSSIKRHKDASYPNISTTPKFMQQKVSSYGRPATLEKS